MAQFRRIVTGIKASKKTGKPTMGSSGQIRFTKRVRVNGRKIAATVKRYRKPDTVRARARANKNRG